MPSIDTSWQLHGLRVIRLENDQLCLDVLPELGAKIYNFIHKPSGRNLLFHNPRLDPAPAAFGACFDDNWCGGWDELLPNDLPRPAPGGDMLPDHGEFWAQKADWQVLSVSATSCEVRFSMNGRVLPTRFEKTILLTAGDPFARVRYSYANQGPEEFPALWNLHPALAVGAHTWLDVPAGHCMTDPWREKRFPGNAAFDWPHAVDRDGRKVDLRRVEPESSAVADMHYLTDVSQGWYAVTDQQAGVGFALSFPLAVFPHAWLFRTFGGWRGLNTLILEASSGYPYDLEVAARNGTCLRMKPHATLEAEVLAIPYAGMKSVAGVEANGRVVPGGS